MAAAFLAHAKVTHAFACNQREHVDHARFPEIFGCDEPEDDLGRGQPGCRECDAFVHHDERGPHGQWHLGVPGYGFRTNRCPRSWARHDFVDEVVHAWSWAESPGGGFLAAEGPDPPARLVEAIGFYRMERGAVRDWEWRERKAEQEAESRSRGEG